MSTVNKPKAIICMAAGTQQIPVINAAHSLGLEVICIDRDENAAGFRYCDTKIICSTYEAQKALQHIEAITSIFDIVCVVNRSSGPPVMTTAILNQALGLSSTLPEMAKNVVNKNLFRKVCNENDLPIPKYEIFCRAFQVKKLKFRPPYIVKPGLSLVGKSGIHYVGNTGDLDMACQDAFNNSINGRILIEEFIEGEDIVLLSLVRDGILIPIILLDELNSIVKGKIVPFSMAVPSQYSSILEKITELAALTADVFQVNNSPFSLSCRYDITGNLTIIEAHLDIGGDLIYDCLIPKSISFNAIEFILKCLVFNQCKIALKKLQPAAVIFDRGIKGRTKVITASSRAQLDYMLGLEKYA